MYTALTKSLSQGKFCPTATLPTTNLILAGLGVNLGLQSDRLRTASAMVSSLLSTHVPQLAHTANTASINNQQTNTYFKKPK
jgi:hypothetical protein